MTPPAPAAAAGSRLRWLWLASLAVTLALLVTADLAHLRWAAQLSGEGSPAPPRDAASPTGYALNQRHFLGTHLRGETYRWIESTQAELAGENLRAGPYLGDSLPTGRHLLLPRLYAGWLHGIARSIHLVAGQPLPLAAEQAALVEPIVSHALAFLLLVGVLWGRLGAAGAATGGLFVALYPPLTGQFIPGALTADTWALLLGTGALLLALPPAGDRRVPAPVGVGAALAAGLALWLNPALGVPVVLLGGLAGAAPIRSGGPTLHGPGGRPVPFLRWSGVGAAVVGLAWLFDRAPWDPAAGELRYVHPLYAFAWLGFGCGLHAWQIERQGNRRGALVGALAAVAMIAPLAAVQLRHGFPGWLYTGAELGRLTSLDETVRFNHALEWLAQARAPEIFFVAGPIVAAVLAAIVALGRRGRAGSIAAADLLPVALAFAGVTLLALFKVRWCVAAAVLAVPLLWRLTAPAPSTWRWSGLAAGGVFLFALAAWHQALPDSLRRPQGELVPRAADLEAMVFRHFSHWLASHTPGAGVRVLAPPALADAVVYHGDGRVLMSTAWESHPGLVAASRVLSSPESTEAEAVIDSLGLTHLVVTSWDRVLPLLVKDPLEEDRDTLYQRLQHWVLPRYLRAIPYRLPATPGYEAQKLAVFAVVPPQDEALSLSRLAEYFVEMERPEPAGLVARALVDAFPQDPNAAMARAVVYEMARYDAGFQAELDLLAANIAAGIVPRDWDRRVVRAIVLALGKRHELARAELTACLAAVTADDLRQLTPLQAFRLRRLMDIYQLDFPATELSTLAHALSAEYQS